MLRRAPLSVPQRRVTRSHENMSGALGQSASELATSLAIMHATLESTTDAILVTDGANCVRHFNEKYIKLWKIPLSMAVSSRASKLWDHIRPQLKDPVGHRARIEEIIASSAAESFDILHRLTIAQY
jgi:PAS domain-containing protein